MNEMKSPTPCPLCGRYHERPTPTTPDALSEAERADIDAAVRAAVDRQFFAPDAPDLGERIRAARGGAR